MEQSDREKRLRLLVRRVNKQRKKQAKQIDILCNDLIGAHRQFIKRLDAISFAADFYQALVGHSDLGAVLDTAGAFIRAELPGATVAFFLGDPERFDLYLPGSAEAVTVGKDRLESCFTSELIAEICRSNSVCAMEDMLAMGLQGNPRLLSRLSAASIPLSQQGRSVGLVLIYRSCDAPLASEDIERIAAVMPALARAVSAARVPLNQQS